MLKPLLIIVNGPPGAGKTTLAARLATDLRLPVLNRDGIAEVMFDGLDCQVHGRPVMIGSASFKLLHYFAGLLLAAGQSLIIEGSFYTTDLASAEFRELQQAHDFEPFQVQCKGEGAVFLERFLARFNTPERHIYHRDLEFAERNGEIILRGRFADLELGGRVVDVDMTEVHSYDYTGLLQTLRSALASASNC